MITDVLHLAQYGLYPVRVHYPIFSGGTVRCSCGNSSGHCDPGPTTSIGKHPVNKAWGKSASTDTEVIQDQFGNADWNVGIVLGICTGIPADQAVIDIEDDTEEGLDLANMLLGDCPTPSYSSGKSTHRIYRWSDRLPRRANWKHKGCEFRFGGDSKQTQSVAPPSMHHSGRQYKWLPGLSLDDLPIAELPDHVIDWICENWARDASKSSASPGNSDVRKFRSPRGKICHPGRHDALLAEANRLWRHAFEHWGINCWDESDKNDQLWMWLWGCNLAVCEPPKTESEVSVIFRSAKAYMYKEILDEIEEKEQRDKEISSPEEFGKDSFGGWLHRHGIRMEFDKSLPDGQESPERIDEWVCNWKMQYLTEGDEELIAVHFEGMEKPSIMTHTEFFNSRSFARRVAQDTKGSMCLDRTFAYWTWETIWSGKLANPKKPKGIVRGLREFLLNKAEVVEHAQQDLAGQLEDMILGMAGNLDRIKDQLEKWANAERTYPEGRLNLSPIGELSLIKPPEDPVSGWYLSEGQILLLVKNDELNRFYRKSYGTGVTNRVISEVMTGEKLGFKRTKFNSGPLAGRWYARKEENSKE